MSLLYSLESGPCSDVVARPEHTGGGGRRILDVERDQVMCRSSVDLVGTFHVHCTNDVVISGVDGCNSGEGPPSVAECGIFEKD